MRGVPIAIEKVVSSRVESYREHFVDSVVSQLMLDQPGANRAVGVEAAQVPRERIRMAIWRQVQADDRTRKLHTLATLWALRQLGVPRPVARMIARSTTTLYNTIAFNKDAWAARTLQGAFKTVYFGLQSDNLRKLRGTGLDAVFIDGESVEYIRPDLLAHINVLSNLKGFKATCMQWARVKRGEKKDAGQEQSDKKRRLDITSSMDAIDIKAHLTSRPLRHIKG